MKKYRRALKMTLNNPNRFVTIFKNECEKNDLIDFCNRYGIKWSTGATVDNENLSYVTNCIYFTYNRDTTKYTITRGSVKYLGKGIHNELDRENIVPCTLGSLILAIEGKCQTIPLETPEKPQEPSKGEELTNTTRYTTTSGKQLLDVMRDDLLTHEEYVGGLKFNCYKYITRYKQKNGVADLEKAKVYLDELIKITKDE